jgi:hypothetical protein
MAEKVLGMLNSFNPTDDKNIVIWNVVNFIMSLGPFRFRRIRCVKLHEEYNLQRLLWKIEILPSFALRVSQGLALILFEN